MMWRGGRAAALALVASCTVALSACSAAEPVGEDEMSFGSEQVKALADQEASAGNLDQASALADGSVDFVEYEAAFSRLRACLETSGIAVSDPVISPVSGNRFEYSQDFGDRDQQSALADIDSCEAEHWRSVSIAFSLVTPAEMDRPLAEATATCVSSSGLNVTGREVNLREFVESVGQANEAIVLDCVFEKAQELYPDLPSLTIGY